MVRSHRCSAEEVTSTPLLPETAEEVWNEPQHPQMILHLHCGELLRRTVKNVYQKCQTGIQDL